MTLMALSTKINQLPGVDRAMIGMGTDMNKEFIREAGMMTPEIEAATPSEMMQVMRSLAFFVEYGADFLASLGCLPGQDLRAVQPTLRLDDINSTG